jgi:hypothetical protein
MKTYKLLGLLFVVLIAGAFLIRPNPVYGFSFETDIKPWITNLLHYSDTAPQPINTSWVKDFLARNPQYTEEDIVGRDAYSIHIKRPDGQIEAEFLQNPINYKNDQGAWDTLDTAITASDDSRYDYQNTTNSFQTYFSSNAYQNQGNIKLVKGDASLTIKTIDKLTFTDRNETLTLSDLAPKTEEEKQAKKGIVDAQEQNKICYPKLYEEKGKTMDICYIVKEGRIQEQLILNQYQGYPELTQTIILTNAYAKKEDKQISFYNAKTNELLWYILDPVMYEQKDLIENRDLQYDLTCNQPNTRLESCSSLNITKILEPTAQNFLADPGRHYPVVIDPDYADTTNDGFTTGSAAGSDYATARSTSTSQNNSNATFKVGQDFTTPTYSLWRSYLKFNTSSIGSGSTVTQVNLKMVIITKNLGGGNFDVQIVKQDWSASDPISGSTRETLYDNCLAGTADDNIWRNTSGIAVNTQYTSGNLNTSWVNKTGYTYYSLRSSKDYANTAPTGAENVAPASQDNATSSYRPVLTVVLADCTSVPNSGNYQITTGCVFPDNVNHVNGVDTVNGSANSAVLTIGSAGTPGYLSVLCNQTIAAGSIVLTNGSLTIIKNGDGSSCGATIKPGAAIYLTDADGDGYAADTTTQSLTGGTGKIRRSASEGVDTNDAQACATADTNVSGVSGSALVGTTCQKCATGALANQLNSEDLWTQCAASYNGCSTTCVKSGSGDNCNGSSAACGTATANVAAGKICSSGSEADATSPATACDTETHSFCTGGACTGTTRWSECNSNGTCDTTATTNYAVASTINAAAGESLNVSCVSGPGNGWSAGTTCQKCDGVGGNSTNQTNSQDLYTQCTTGGGGTGTVCRSPNCSGTGAACGFLTGSTTCRAKATGCDVAETCSGSADTCPTDTFAAAGSCSSCGCSTFGCTNYCGVFTGVSCKAGATNASKDGKCDGSGNCYSTFGQECYTSGNTLASCGSTGCNNTSVCAAGAAKATCDTTAEVCYTSGLQGCTAGNICNSTGTCVPNCVLESPSANCSGACSALGWSCVNGYSSSGCVNNPATCNTSSTYCKCQ